MTTKTKRDYDSEEQWIEETMDYEHKGWTVRIHEYSWVNIGKKWLQERMEGLESAQCYMLHTFFEGRGSHSMYVVISGEHDNAYVDWHNDCFSVPGAGSIDEVIAEVFEGDKGMEELRVYRFRPDYASSAIIFAKHEAHAIPDYMHGCGDGDRFIIEADSMPRLELHALPEFKGY